MYTKILQEEMVSAFGCTEPIALALAACRAAEVLAKKLDHIIVYCSGNMIKNAKSVIVPGTNGKKGIEISVVLGAIAGDCKKGLEVLNGIDSSYVTEAEKLIASGICKVVLEPDIPGLYIKVEVFSGEQSASVTVTDSHTHVTEIMKDGKRIFKNEDSRADQENTSEMSFKDIYEYADTTDLSEMIPILDREIQYNMAIADEGLKGNWGSNVGSTIIGKNPSDTVIAYAAAASDARMSGCEMPVVINSGSGNQGITVSVPVIVYAKENNIPQESLYRALLLSNLIAIYLKQGIGKLSAYCGVVSAAAASAAGIAYLKGASLTIIEATVSNSLATVSGMICDGAKPSCASKIASALATGLMSYDLAIAGGSFESGDGIVKENIDRTIACVAAIAKDGMRQTDTTILKLMISR